MLVCFFFLRTRRQPKFTLTDTLFPYTTLFRSNGCRSEALRSPAVSGRGRQPAAACPRPAGPVRWTTGRTACDARSRTGAHSRRAPRPPRRSDEHTSELQSLMRISYAVFCLKKKKKQYPQNNQQNNQVNNK